MRVSVMRMGVLLLKLRGLAGMSKWGGFERESDRKRDLL